MEPSRAEANALGCAGLRDFSAPLTATKVKHIWVWLILVMVLLVYRGLTFPFFSLFLFFWRLVLCYLTYANRTGQSHQVPFHCSGCSGMSRYCPDNAQILSRYPYISWCPGALFMVSGLGWRVGFQAARRWRQGQYNLDGVSLYAYVKM